MAKQFPIVRIVDDDESFCLSQKLFLQAMGWFVQTYSSAKAFLENDYIEQPGCLILDVRMPEMTGLELQEAMIVREVPLPIIFLTGHGDVNMAVHALQHGAFDFLQKPVDPEKLHEVVSRAVEHSLALCEQSQDVARIRQVYDTLTPREQDVVKLAAMDKSNKEIGDTLCISLPTVKMHRSNAFLKLGVKGALEAYWLLETIGVVEKGGCPASALPFVPQKG